MTIHDVITEDWYGGPTRAFSTQSKCDEYKQQMTIDCCTYDLDGADGAETVYIVNTEQWYGSHDNTCPCDDKRVHATNEAAEEMMAKCTCNCDVFVCEVKVE